MIIIFKSIKKNQFLVFENFLIKKKSVANITIIKITATTGANNAKKVIIPAPAFSVVETTEFPIPPVVREETARNFANPALTVAAVPPPAIMASTHSGTPLISPN